MKKNEPGIASQSGGVLICDKPSGMTSHDAVNRIRRLYRTKKVGHTGTLDPMATGVLCILIERCAKAAEYLVSDEKKYEAVLRLGTETDTGDIEGAVKNKCDDIPSQSEVLSVIKTFVGPQKQVPPMYSALKKDGVKLVDLARRGIEIERQARDIEIFSLEAEKISETDYALKVHCSKGTYIRSLCADIGARLGCYGTMAALRRTKSGSFSIEDAVTLEALEKMTDSEKLSLLNPTESLFSELPRVNLLPFFAKLAHSGNELYQKKIGTNFEIGQRVTLYDENGFFALGEVFEFPDGLAVKPIKFFIL